jgi:hypothetical protein
MKMSMLVFWVVTPCGLVGRYFNSKDEESIYLLNVGIYQQVHTALQTQKTNIGSVSSLYSDQVDNFLSNEVILFLKVI